MTAAMKISPRNREPWRSQGLAPNSTPLEPRHTPTSKSEPQGSKSFGAAFPGTTATSLSPSEPYSTEGFYRSLVAPSPTADLWTYVNSPARNSSPERCCAIVESVACRPRLHPAGGTSVKHCAALKRCQRQLELVNQLVKDQREAAWIASIRRRAFSSPLFATYRLVSICQFVNISPVKSPVSDESRTSQSRQR